MVSVVWDAVAGHNGLERGFWNRDMNKMMTKMLIKIVMRHKQWYQDNPKYDLKKVVKAKTLREFDEAFTKRMFNYESAEDYQRACTHKDKIDRIKVPTFCLQAGDDMMAVDRGEC